jgi:predicted phage tail protein
MPGLDKIMGMMGGGDPMSMINQIMQMVKPQQDGESGQASDGGKQDPVAQFNQAMELAKG